ncbi:hypothetical protein ACFQ1S_21125 [Kibdelosporangium lantanae]|uniref:Secreted protein n=1 Tax=Kibdelosporangium lantanae TaxID=1497396 RepID=A0ABW3MFP6_9PSEU
MRGERLGSLIGAVGGLVFIVVNAGELANPTGLVVRVVQHQVRHPPLPAGDPVGHPHRALSVHEGQASGAHRRLAQ